MGRTGIFKIQSWQQSFDEKGYIVIDSIEEALLEALGLLLQKIPSKKNSVSLYASNFEADYQSNLIIENGIRELLNEQLKHIFQDYHFLTGHFMSKPPSPDSEFQLHQDWSITDEQNYDVVHLWIPLQDTDSYNGGMFVVEGSHLFFNNLRSGSLDIPRLQTDRYVKKMITPLIVKRGQMLVYHPALFHGSFSNNSDVNREAVLVNLLQKDAPLFYYHLASANEVEVYALNKKALLTDLPLMAKGKLPVGLRLIGTQTLEQSDNAAITSKDLYKRFRQRNVATATSFFQRMRRMFLGGH
jgi:hypothetical protein